MLRCTQVVLAGPFYRTENAQKILKRCQVKQKSTITI